jgi:hypothetical protein
MPQRQRLTNSSDETAVSNLLSGENVFVIPYFQRPYKWKTERLDQLNADLLSLVDETNDAHFLGAVIIHGRRTNPSDPDVFEVIDGQQRITTLYLYLCAIVKTLCELDEHAEAAGLFLKYVAIGRPVSLVSNAKLHPCKDDREQLNFVLMNFVLTELLQDPNFKEQLPQFTFKALPSTAADRGRLRNNYRFALRFFKEQAANEGVTRVRQLNKKLLDAVSVVQIDVWDPTNGPKIFDSLNSRQEPMTTGDLVRNEVFRRLADESPDQIEQVDQEHWQQFYKKFKVTDARGNETNYFDDYFFPYGLITDSNLKKSEVYSRLRSRWREQQDPVVIIHELAQYQSAFLDLVCDTNQQQHDTEVAAAFSRLYSAGTPSSTFPFLMQLSNAIRTGSVSHENGTEVLRLIESFLVRRALCGHEPTGLHAVFKRLWADCGGTPDVSTVTTAIRSHKTVPWPDSDTVRTEMMTRPLYRSSVTRHFVVEYNRSLGGDQPTRRPWIEHILPDTLGDAWSDTFTREQHDQLKDVIGNLLPLSQEMNQGLGNQAYLAKRQVYRSDSGFKAARVFAEQNEYWTPHAIEQRCRVLGDWAVERWKY